MNVAKKRQLNLSVSDETLERIDALITTLKKKNRNQIGAEVLEIYLDHYEAVELQKLQMIEEQRRASVRTVTEKRRVG